MSKASSHGWFVAVVFLASWGCSSSSSEDGVDGSGSGGSNGSGGSSGTSGINDLPDPCTLLTSAELGAIVDVGLVRSERVTGLTGDPGCTWYDALDNAVFQVALWDGFIQYDFSAMRENSSPLSGIGEEAHLGSLDTVHVKLSTNAFFTQSLVPVADGQISPEIAAAATGSLMSRAGEYEAAFRVAKLVEAEL